MDELPPELVFEDVSGHTTGRKSGRIEVLVRAERRRAWTAEQKREIVAESLGPDVTPAEIARKHGITTGQLYTWRRQMVSRRSRVPPQPGTCFAPVELEVSGPMSTTTAMPVASAPATPNRPEGLIEIVLPSGVSLRVDARVDNRALRRVLEALESR